MKNVDFQYSGNFDIAEIKFKEGEYGEARCQYQIYLSNIKDTSKNKQMIEYLKRKIEDCNRLQK